MYRAAQAYYKRTKYYYAVIASDHRERGNPALK